MWFVASAFALAAPCFPMRVVEHLPQDGDLQVPLDVVPVLVVNTSCGVGELALTLRDELEVVHTLTLPAAALEVTERPTLVELALDAELAPDTRYTLDIAVDGQPTDTFSFVTGAGPASSPMGPPGLEVLHAERRSRPDAPFVAQIAVTPVDAGRLFVVASEGDDVAVFVGPGPEPFEADIAWPRIGDGRRFCLTVRERGLTGWSDPSDEVCDRAEGCGCSHGRSPGLFGGLLLASLLLIRRRRA